MEGKHRLVAILNHTHIPYLPVDIEEPQICHHYDASGQNQKLSSISCVHVCACVCVHVCVCICVTIRVLNTGVFHEMLTQYGT